MKNKLTYLFLLVSCIVFGQSVGVGQFADHLPYGSAKALCKAGNKVFVATDPTLFTFDKDDSSIDTYSKVNKLSDLGVQVVEYSATYNTVIIGYSTGNIDVIVNNQVINIPDIERSTIQGFKSINNILIKDEYAYLSCGFGIVQFDIQRNEIKETFFIGNDASSVFVNQVGIFQDTIYAATKQGVYYAPLNGVNLSDFQNWNILPNHSSGNYNALAVSTDLLAFNLRSPGYNEDTVYTYNGTNWDKMTFPGYNNEDLESLNYINGEWFVCHTYNGWIVSNDFSSSSKVWTYGENYDGVRPRKIIPDGDGTYWIADEAHGLIHRMGEWTHDGFAPNGPDYFDSWAMAYQDEQLWVVSGSLTPSRNNNYSRKGMYRLKNGLWESYNGGAYDTILDLTSLAIDPNNSERVYAGSWGGGLAVVESGSVTTLLNESNSSIQTLSLFPWRGIGGVNYDSEGNMWVACSGVPGVSVSNPLVAYDGTNWYEFNLDGLLSTNTQVSGVMVDQQDNIWVISRGNGLFVYNWNGTLSDPNDDELVLISSSTTSGNLPTTTIYDVAEDDDGKIWIGTEEGLVVIQSTAELFDGGVTAERIIIEQDGNYQYLLETDIITTIKVDGGNRKWIGTSSGGVYLISEDGQETIHHFTAENSPLLSNSIFDIEIFGSTGEVFFATERGLMSYTGDATDPEAYDGPTYAYPNPVPSGYSGTIGIRGLVSNAEVKITDIVGNVVYETISEGGSATWDGKTLSGQKVQTGVYIVFSVSDDGTEKEVTKILFIN